MQAVADLFGHRAPPTPAVSGPAIRAGSITVGRAAFQAAAAGARDGAEVQVLQAALTGWAGSVRDATGRWPDGLGRAGLQAIGVLLGLAKLPGTLEPAVATIAERAHCGVTTAHAALAAARALGLIDRIRRYLPGRGWGEPPRQTSNLYLVAPRGRRGLPPALQRCLPAWWGTQSPIPDDEAQRHADRDAAWSADLNRLDVAERTVALTDPDSETAGVLRRMAEARVDRQRR